MNNKKFMWLLPRVVRVVVVWSSVFVVPLNRVIQLRDGLDGIVVFNVETSNLVVQGFHVLFSFCFWIARANSGGSRICLDCSLRYNPTVSIKARHWLPVYPALVSFLFFLFPASFVFSALS